MLYKNLILVLLGLFMISCSGTVPSVGNEVSVQEVEESAEVQLWEEQKPGEKTAGEDFQVQCGCKSGLPSNEGKYFISPCSVLLHDLRFYRKCGIREYL